MGYLFLFELRSLKKQQLTYIQRRKVKTHDMKVPIKVPKQQCEKIPQKSCTEVAVKVPKTVPEKVPTEVCEEHGYGHGGYGSHGGYGGHGGHGGFGGFGGYGHGW